MSDEIEFKSINVCRKCRTVFHSTKKLIVSDAQYCWDCDPAGELSKAGEKRAEKRSRFVEDLGNRTYNPDDHFGTPADGKFGDFSKIWRTPE